MFMEWECITEYAYMDWYQFSVLYMVLKVSERVVLVLTFSCHLTSSTRWTSHQPPVEQQKLRSHFILTPAEWFTCLPKMWQLRK